MKDLVLWDVSTREVNTDSKKLKVVCFGHNDNSPDTNVYFCTDNLIISKINSSNEVVWRKNLSDEIYCLSDLLNVTFLSLPSTVCVGLANGEIITTCDSGTDCVSELVGKCDSGLLALEWSPDQELLAVVTKDLRTILMSCLFDPIKENDLLCDEFGEKQFITVGWGKKETQFHGSEGKQAAKLKKEIVAEQNVAGQEIVKITWRGDGELYAIGYGKDGIRQFKVFDREGNLQYTSEKHQGLECNLAWRPSGNVIATSQKLPDKYCISFFEKNGLKHGEFIVKNGQSCTIEDIIWSSDSEVLALLCKDLNTNTQTVLLYTTSNYHWYLKQVLNFSEGQQICKIVWENSFDSANAKKLNVVLHNGQYLAYSWIWTIHHSQGKGSDDDAIVAVTDGNDVLLTGIRQTVVPPPMSAYKLTVNSFINSIHFAPPDHEKSNIDTNMFFIVTDNQEIIFYEETHKFPLQYNKLNTITLKKFEFPYQCYNWIWLNADTLICAKIDKYGTHYLLEHTITSDTCTVSNICELPDTVLRIERHPEKSTEIFLQLKNGDIVQYYKGGIISPTDICFSAPCHTFKIICVEEKLHYLGLTHNGHFYVDGSLCMNDVSSFFIHTHFLLMTSLRHVLICTELNAVGLNSIMEYQKTKLSNVYERKIERGAKLVIAVPNGTRTVFQMPRGNVETIQPRSLSLKIIGEYLDNLYYYEAFDLMRKQRINLNLFYDHNPDKFTQNIKVFLNSIENNSWLSLFISDLENVDVTKTMYASSYSNDNVHIVQDKISNVCNLVRENLINRSDKDNRLLPILTSYVKINNVENLEKALLIIKELKHRETEGEKLPVSSDEALKYLLYLVDVNNLFDISLGMYDFDLVLLVANKSQKDPKEFIPMLNELNDMEENYKRFTINKHLKRFDKAVHSLILCGPTKHEELKTFVKYHSLYRDALDHFNTEKNIYREIANDFGMFLRLKKNYIESGIVYERAKNVDKAIECYKEALEWELAIKLAHNEWTDENFKELCKELIQCLTNDKRHKEAIKILEKYCGDVNETIKYAIESGQYKTAIRLITEDDHLMGEQLLSAVLEEYSTFKDQIKSNRDTFKNYKERLHVLRENKLNNPTELYHSSYANNDGDLYSDAGSTVASSSRASTRSFRSSKNRRKHERKVASLKEGSQYEDVALIMALHNLISSSFELRVPVKEVLIALSYCNKDKEAEILQVLLENLLKDMKDSFNVIWTNELMIESAKSTIAASNLPEGCSIIPQGLASLELHMRIPPIVPNINWKLGGLRIG